MNGAMPTLTDTPRDPMPMAGDTDLVESPQHLPADPATWHRMAVAIDYLTRHWEEQPDLETVAQAAGLSPFHFQRLFRAHVGVSPKRFCQYLTLSHAKARLSAGTASLLDTALDVGLSGPSRLHDLFVACEAMTPGEYKALGADLVIRWGVHWTPLGQALVATTGRGICWFGFVPAEEGLSGAIAEFEADWRLATRMRDDAGTAGVVTRIFSDPDRSSDAAEKPLPLLLRGTNFQIKVWEALLRIAPGDLATYGDIAREVGTPKAARAVGAAVGANLISLLIPCHRVILRSGILHNYRWGPDRKRALIAWEAARHSDAPL